MSETDPLAALGDVGARALASVVAQHAPPGEAEDLAQELRLFLLQHAEQVVARFAGRSSLDTYLHGVLAKQALKRLRPVFRWKTRHHRIDRVHQLAAPARALDTIIEREGRYHRRLAVQLGARSDRTR